MEKSGYPNYVIGELTNEEYKKKTRNGEVKSNFDMVEFICDKGYIYISKISNHITLSNRKRSRFHKMWLDVYW